MARLDKFHAHVKEAIEKDGWTITHDPYILRLRGEVNTKRDYPIDLAAEKLIAAQKDKEIIAVEVKTFGGSSVIHDFHEALGQYMDYLVGLSVQEPERKLFLAITDQAYQEILSNPLASLSVKHYKIPIILFDPITQRITQWIT